MGADLSTLVLSLKRDQLWKFPALALGVALLALLSIALARETGRIASIWPVNGLVLFALLRARQDRWTGFLIAGTAGFLTANLLAGDAPLLAVSIAAANIVEITLAAVICRRLCGPQFDARKLRHLVVLMAPASVLAAMASASLATIVIVALENQPAFEIWIRWFSADALGLMIVTPCLLVMRRHGVRRAFKPFRSKEGVALLAGLTLALAIVFSQSSYPLLFLVIAWLVIAATTLPTASVVVMLTIACLVSIASTVTGHGPMSLVAGDRSVQLLVLQLYMATSTLITLVVSSATAARLSTLRSLNVALKRKERDAHRLALASQIAGIGYWRMKRGMQRVDCSPEALKIFGMDPDARPYFQDFLDCYAPADAERVEAASLASLTQGAPLDQRVSLRRVNDGETRMIHVRADPVLGPHGDVVALEGVIHDVTEAARLMHEVSLSELRYRELAEGLPDLVLRARQRKIIYASSACRRLLGYSPSELEGRDLAEFVHPEDVGASLERYAGYERGHLPTETRREQRVRTALGEWIWLEGNPHVVMGPTGEVEEVIIVLRDVTERRAIEDGLAAGRDAAQAAARIKADFVANMSHEIRTPLTAILGYAGLLARDEGVDGTALKRVQRINSAGAALLSIVNNVLDFSKLEADQVDIHRRACDVTQLLHDTAMLFEPQMNAKRLELRLDISELPPQLEIDPDRVRQVVTNLLGNAVKFTSVGHVALIARYDLDSSRLELVISDTGPGMDAEQQSRLFQRFSQVHGASAQSVAGTGLGLAISKGLIEAMDGTIALESQVGAGSAFAFSLPAEIAAPVVSPHEDPEDALVDLVGVRVLVADDNPVNREIVRALLEQFGVIVTDADGGREAVRRAEAEQVDVILMDLRMPEFDGRQALRAIREGAGPNSSAPILAFTADGDSEAAQLAPGGGFSGLVRKPVVVAELVRELGRAASARAA
jgi:PAS domain S-box-containing protein